MEKLFLKSALQQAPIEMIYQAKDGTFSKRIIIVKKVTGYTILAYCLTKKQFRTFIIDKIFAAQPYKHYRNIS